ncbi:MAG TPA: cytochrome b/b6 domain-containing protein [Actinomycetes bacterium]|nr:cytochrome b/b6 domain-containing protein [Actinomycetes bacterium]
MRLRNDATGYGLVTKTLHWLTVVLLVLQFTIGYLVDDEGGRGRGRGRGEDSGHGRGRGGDDDYTFGFGDGDDTLLSVHVVIGSLILALTLFRIAWRKLTPLPAWAPSLSLFERKLATWTERVLYACLIAIPLSGLALFFTSDDLLAFHIATHIAFFVAISVHLGLVLKHQLINRERLIGRML